MCSGSVAPALEEVGDVLGGVAGVLPVPPFIQALQKRRQTALLPINGLLEIDLESVDDDGVVCQLEPSMP